MTRKEIQSCVVYRRHEGPPYASCSPPDLPAERVCEDPPFSHTGVDFSGPIQVNSAKQSDRQERAYVCLFTCASICSVHLELTHDMTVEGFLLALQRYAGRKDLSATLTSDNTKTFKSCKKVTKKARSAEVLRFLSSNKITWRFIVERAP